MDFTQLAQEIKEIGKSIGFQQVGISNLDLTLDYERLKNWIAKEWHGEMSYMTKHGHKRGRPDELVPGTIRIIVVRMDYLPENINDSKVKLLQSEKAYISRYALGKDYHKLLKKRLQQFAQKINEHVNNFSYRSFVDSAPVLEKPLAIKGGLGWGGKNTLVLNRDAGSYFFLGSIFTNIPLPVDQKLSSHCGTCTACIDVCPTKAIVAPYQLDARKCISYLTIEYKGSIDEELRPLMGNRIFGCDDCQLFCPWNRYAKITTEPDFQPRHGLADAELITLFAWTETEFLQKTEGSAIRRATYIGWLRNIAIALGNAKTSPAIIQALKSRLDFPSELVQEHVQWALRQHDI